MKDLIKKILREQISTELEQDLKAFHPDLGEIEEGKKKKTKKDACYRKVKSRYKVWPSAYASGALVKCRKVGAKNWGNSTKEEVELNEGMYGMSEPLDYVVVDRRNLRPLMMNHRDGYYEKWSTEEKAQADADDLNRAYQKTYGAVEGPHVVMYKSDYFAEKRKEAMMEGKKRKLTKKPSSETSLRDWFGRKGAKGSTGGWVDCNAPDGKGGYKSCGRKEGESRKKYPACRPTPAACKSKGKGKKWGKKSSNESITEQYNNFTEWGELIQEAEYKGRKVKLNKPTRGDVKKFKVYVKNDKGNVVKVNFGHGGTSAKKKGEKTMRIKKSNPERRKAFRARHNCDNPGPKWKARYWSCKAW